MKTIIAALITFVVIGCVSYTPEEQSYLDRIATRTSEATFPEDETEEIWSRCKAFVSERSDLPITIATDNLIQTSKETAERRAVWTVNKIRFEDSIKIKVDCSFVNDPGSVKAADAGRNERIFIDYLITDELPYTHFIAF